MALHTQSQWASHTNYIYILRCDADRDISQPGLVEKGIADEARLVFHVKSMPLCRCSGHNSYFAHKINNSNIFHAHRYWGSVKMLMLGWAT